MKQVIFLVFFTMIACRARETTGLNTAIIKHCPEDVTIPNWEKIDYEKLVDFAEKNQGKIKSLRQFIWCLPDRLFENFTLIYDSKSLQPASMDRPRVIAYDPVDNIFLAYPVKGESTLNDPRGQIPGAFDMLEVGQYRDTAIYNRTAHRFDFYEMSIGEKITYTSADSPNPEKCLSCHQSLLRMDKDPRPNWEGYSQWPGAYGSDDDFLTLQVWEGSTSIRLQGLTFEQELIKLNLAVKEKWPDSDSLTVKERLALIAFLKSAESIPEYQRLQNLSSSYSIPKNAVRSAAEHNSTLTLRLYDLNNQRMARMIEESKLFERSKVMQLVMYNLWGCAEKENIGGLADDGDLADDIFKEKMPLHFDNFEDYSPSFARSLRSDFSEPIDFVGDFSLVLMQKAPEAFAELKAFIVQFRYGSANRERVVASSNVICPKLSVAIKPKHSIAERNWRFGILECVRCHHEKSTVKAPRIPFENRMAMRQWVTEGKTSVEKLLATIALHEKNPNQMMPPDVKIPEIATKSLKDYFNSLR